MFDLTGKTAFVTGSSRGIGKAIAIALKQAGAEVILHGSAPSQALTETSQAINAKTVCADLTQGSAVDDIVRQLDAIGTSPDILVLNASIQSYTGIANFDINEFQKMAIANTAVNFQLLQRLTPKMAEKKWGRIIAISSVNQLNPASRLAIYGSTKAALANMMRGAVPVFAADGITCNTICPGVITTDRNSKALSNKEFADTLRQQIPARRFGTPEDCAGIVVFLASDEASYVNGAEIPVSGGWSI